MWSHEETDILNLINTDEKNSGKPPFATTKADPARTAIFRHRVYYGYASNKRFLFPDIS